MLMPCQKQWKLCVIFQVASKAHFTVINLHLIPLDINDYLHATVVVGDRWWFRSRAGRAASSKGQERAIMVQRKENWARGNAWIHRSSKFRYKTLFLPPTLMTVLRASEMKRKMALRWWPCEETGTVTVRCFFSPQTVINHCYTYRSVTVAFPSD